MRSCLKRRAVSLLATLLLVFAAFLPAAATEATNPVTADRDGVFLVRMVVNDAQKGIQNLEISTGSGFLINESTIITCYHVTHLSMANDEELIEAIMEALGYSSYSELDKHLDLQVVYQADLYMEATELKGSEKMDFSILALEQPISGHTCLTLREEPVKDLEVVYALGFPYTVSSVESSTSHSYTASDVTVTDAKVSKASAVVDGVEYIRHSALLAGGNSGGPLVDENGYVVGVNRMVDSETESFGWAISINQVIDALKTNAIAYNSVAGESGESGGGSGKDGDDGDDGGQNGGTIDPPVEPVDTSALTNALAEANAKLDNAEKYTQESVSALESAVNQAEAARNSTDQTEIDRAAQDVQTALNGLEERSSNGVVIAVIAIAAVLVIAIVVTVVLLTRKKKPVSEPASVLGGGSTGGFAPSIPKAPTDYVGSTGSTDTSTDVLSGTPQTSVLGGAPNTTVLNKPAFASLTRVATGEKVDISSSEFVIGRERNANFYVTNNTAIGRRHAKIVNQSGQISLVDLASTNGTFVNGAKANANVPVMLKDGDKIMLADETFTISIF